jgi:SAM-dependent methyltransferase
MLEIDETFASIEDWLAYAERRQEVYQAAAAERVARRILAQGFVEPHSGCEVLAREITAPNGNWREELSYAGLNSRLRAVLALIAEAVAHQQPEAVAIYAPEAVTAFAAAASSAWPGYVGSEYLPTPADRARFPCVQHQDLTALSFPSDTFDVVATNEVLEHVPDLDRALSEIHRVLKPGGWHIGTHPFRFLAAENEVRARMEDGRVVHLMEPERHGNPTDPDGGSLVFQTPGWEILNLCRKAGFSEAVMRFYASERYGCLTENLGVFVLCAQKTIPETRREGAVGAQPCAAPFGHLGSRNRV